MGKVKVERVKNESFLTPVNFAITTIGVLFGLNAVRYVINTCKDRGGINGLW